MLNTIDELAGDVHYTITMETYETWYSKLHFPVDWAYRTKVVGKWSGGKVVKKFRDDQWPNEGRLRYCHNDVLDRIKAQIKSEQRRRALTTSHTVVEGIIPLDSL